MKPIHEIIIKVFKTKEERDDISIKVASLMQSLNAELKIATDEENYSNEIYQIGENKPEIDVIVK